MEKTENINQIFRDKNYEPISTNEIFQRKILVKKKPVEQTYFFFFFFFLQFNGTPKILNPEQFGGTRDEFEFFIFNMKIKFHTNGDWYFTEKIIDYVFPLLEFFV